MNGKTPFSESNTASRTVKSYSNSTERR